MATLLQALLGSRQNAEIDPYLIWAAATGFRDHALKDLSGPVALAVECHGSVHAFLERLGQHKASHISVPAIYKDKRVIDPKLARFCSVTVPARDTPLLLSLVKRAELGTALAVSPGHGVAQRSSARGRPQPSSNVVIGIIDDFVAFAHPMLADERGHSRVRYVWSQDATAPDCVAPTQWRRLPSDDSYGYELCGLGAEGSGPSAAAPTMAHLLDAYPKVMPRTSHGTAITDLATRSRRADGARTGGLPDIVAVHFPKATLADTSGGALNVQALDGMRYILDRAGAQANVVVNLSYSTMAGPHDGSSILEQAMDELIALRPGRLAVVLPAGNAREQRCHAAFRLGNAHRTQRLQWKVLPDDPTPSFVEIWLPEGLSAHVAIRVTDPLGRAVSLPMGNAGQTFDNPTSPSVGIIRREHSAKGRPTSTVILVALAATSSAAAAATVAPHGVWLIELEHSGKQLGVSAPADVHAWIERDDSIHGQARGGRQSHFVDAGYEMRGESGRPPQDTPGAHVKRAGSFNTIATGDCTLVVGGYVGETFLPAHYSGIGPTRSSTRKGPDALGLSEESPTLHGVRTAAVDCAGATRINGTSVAAPQLCSQIVEWLLSGQIADLSLDSIRGRIQRASIPDPVLPPPRSVPAPARLPRPARSAPRP